LNAAGDASDPLISLRLFFAALRCRRLAPGFNARSGGIRRGFSGADATGRSRRFSRGRALNGLTASLMSGLLPAEDGKSKWEIRDYA
jgi:hypothetical protein